jgi:ECF transporter S component (folate family)
MGWDVAHERKTNVAIQYCVRCCIKGAYDRSSFFIVVLHYGQGDFFMKKINTKTLILMALFAAISIVLARFMVVWLTNSVRISFGNIPIILASLLLGPVAGGLTGAVADIVGATLFSGLGWYPPITIPVVLTGIIPGLLKQVFLKEITIWRVYAVILLSNIITSIGLTTWLLSGLYGTGYLELLVLRAPVSLAVTIVEGLVVYILYKRLSKEFN